MKMNFFSIEPQDTLVRMMLRANHIYILFSGLINLLVSSSIKRENSGNKFYFVTSSILIIATIGISISFYIDPIRDNDKLVGVGNAISDGHLVVYYPHLLVHPDYQGKGIGQMIMDKMQEKYGNFHMQMLTADGKAIDFYQKIGFTRAGKTEPMWIYKGEEH